MIHESGVWSDHHKRWFFLPRRCSKEQYNEKTDIFMSCNVLLVADEHFKEVKVRTTFKFLYAKIIVNRALETVPYNCFGKKLILETIK